MGEKIITAVCAIIAAILGAVAGHYAGLQMNDFLANDFFLLGEGHWTLEAGAPVLAIKSVEYIPAIIGAICGIVYSIRFCFLGIIAGPLIGLAAGGVVGILAYITCLIIGFFITGTWLGLLVFLAVMGETAFPVYWIIVIPFGGD